MMMAHDPKKIAVTIIGAKGPSSYSDAKKANESFDPKADPKAMEEMKSEDDPGLESAAQEFLAAVETKDSKALADAFKAMMDICESYDGDEMAESTD